MKVTRARHNRMRRVGLVVVVLVILAVAAVLTVMIVRWANGLEKEPAPATSTASSQASSQASSSLPESATTSVAEPSSLASSEDGILHEAGDYSDAAFIGDSRTQALETFGVLNNATYYCYKGLMVNTAFTKEVIKSGNQTLTVMDALKQKQFKRVYIMLGVNELGWSSTEVFQQDYTKLIKAVQECQPDATVYVQSILPVSAKKSEQDKIYNNPKINQFNEMIQKLATDAGAVYLEVNKSVMDETGALPVGASADGVHPNIDYCRKWAAYLDENT